MLLQQWNPPCLLKSPFILLSCGWFVICSEINSLLRLCGSKDEGGKPEMNYLRTKSVLKKDECVTGREGWRERGQGITGAEGWRDGVRSEGMWAEESPGRTWQTQERLGGGSQEERNKVWWNSGREGARGKRELVSRHPLNWFIIEFTASSTQLQQTEKLCRYVQHDKVIS